MKQIIIFFGIIALLSYSKELSALLNTVKNNDLSMKILAQMKQMQQEKKNYYDILVFLNIEEDELMKQILQDMNDYQQKQLLNAEKKQELKYQMMLTKFSSTMIGDELQLVQNEAKLSEDIKMQRVDLLQEFSSILPQLDQLYKEEQSYSDQQNSELSLFLQSFSNFSTNNQKLLGQKQHIKENAENILKEFIQTNSDNSSPYSTLINQLQLAEHQNGIVENVQKTKELIQKFQQQNSQDMKMKTDLTQKLQQSLIQDQEQWNMDVHNYLLNIQTQQMTSIEPIAKITKDKLNLLQKQKDDIQNSLKQQQKEYSELQQNIDEFYTTYSSKRLQDMNNLNLVRMIKQFYSEHSEMLEDFMKNNVKIQQ